jgi:uncharacterized protein DUF4342
MDNDKSSSREYQVSSDQVIAKIKEILHEGNVRRIKLKNREGKILLDVSLTIGIAGILLAPTWLAIGALALLTPGLTIVVEKDEAQS